MSGFHVFILIAGMIAAWEAAKYAVSVIVAPIGGANLWCKTFHRA
jgi:hypothetical protein